MDRWHNFRFRMQWPENQRPELWIDLFILDTIIRDVICDHRDKVALWRFHRRFHRGADHSDAQGHQVSLICHTSDKNANGIDYAVKGSASYQFLHDHALLREYLHEEGKPNIESTSCSKWAIEIQKSWPYFINGASEMLLELVGLVRNNLVEQGHAKLLSTNLPEIKRCYVDIERKLTALWEKQGSHAFFHHINALFAYVPLLVQPTGFRGIFASF